MSKIASNVLPAILGPVMLSLVTLTNPCAAWAETQVAGDSAGGKLTGKLTVELNKFEPTEGGTDQSASGEVGCRAYFLFRNETGVSFESFQMSLAIFDKEGVIDRLLAIDAAPLPVARTTLKLFDIPGLACADISQVLLHDIPACKPQNGAAMDCFPLITLQSRTPAALVE